MPRLRRRLPLHHARSTPALAVTLTVPQP
jgi:hypothetical protein